MPDLDTAEPKEIAQDECLGNKTEEVIYASEQTLLNVTNSEAKIEEHVENDEDHFQSVDSMKVTITHSSHGGNGPIQSCNVPNHKTCLLKSGTSDPKVAESHILFKSANK
ncbi:hypothetical protein H5410_010847 [Solanum commersonii]|uniref:Uncharacterized protein n=1 Tax=Solanum commersonii TaxID=4109 RepID=A0A9J6ALV4_SOLCO|nr:hypothetical protein H5410_010847 [Solanum commersonii]